MPAPGELPFSTGVIALKLNGQGMPLPDLQRTMQKEMRVISLHRRKGEINVREEN